MVDCHPNRCEHYQACLGRPERAYCETLLAWEEDKVEIVEDGRVVALFRRDARPRKSASNRPYPERRALILRLLGKRPRVTNPAIARIAHVSESVARRWTLRMVREGDLDVQKFGGHKPAIYTLKGER